MIPIGPILAGLAAAVPAVLDLIPDADPVRARARREGQLTTAITRLSQKLEGNPKPARRAHLLARLSGVEAELRMLQGVMALGGAPPPPQV